jgi:hypothetical protein
MDESALPGPEMSDPAKRMSREGAAKLAGVSPHTVRHYQRLGLVHPEKRPIQTGFAYVYFQRDVERIRAIALDNLDYMAHFRPGLVRYFHEKAQAQGRVLPVSDTGQLYPRGHSGQLGSSDPH